MATAQTDNKKKQDDRAVQPVSAGGGKESEKTLTFEEEKKLVVEIQDRSTELDRVELEKIRTHIPEIKQAVPEPEIPSEVVSSGVVSPQAEADKVISGGATLDLPISEDEYKKGRDSKFSSKVSDQDVVGVSSLIAMVMWVGRLIKMAHKHAMKVVFRRSSFATSSAKATEAKKATEDKGDKNAN